MSAVRVVEEPSLDATDSVAAPDDRLGDASAAIGRELGIVPGEMVMGGDEPDCAEPAPTVARTSGTTSTTALAATASTATAATATSINERFEGAELVRATAQQIAEPEAVAAIEFAMGASIPSIALSPAEAALEAALNAEHLTAIGLPLTNTDLLMPPPPHAPFAPPVPPPPLPPPAAGASCSAGITPSELLAVAGPPPPPAPPPPTGGVDQLACVRDWCGAWTLFVQALHFSNQPPQATFQERFTSLAVVWDGGAWRPQLVHWDQLDGHPSHAINRVFIIVLTCVS